MSMRASFLSSTTTQAYGIHVGSHICLGGVIYTLGVNDQGSHLCLGVIYASDTGIELRDRKIRIDPYASVSIYNNVVVPSHPINYGPGIQLCAADIPRLM